MLEEPYSAKLNTYKKNGHLRQRVSICKVYREWIPVRLKEHADQEAGSSLFTPLNNASVSSVALCNPHARLSLPFAHSLSPGMGSFAGTAACLGLVKPSAWRV